MVRRPALTQLDDSQRRVCTGVAERLAAAGRQAWLVGGCVRDLALARAGSDLDIATDARPEEVERIFQRTIPVGRAFGTVVVTDLGEPVEVTTFRSDGSYVDGRRPVSVSFSNTVEEDAERRDFTCNALYLEPRTGELRDPTGGYADLERGVLRAVGEPTQRFAEDSLRLLRLVRFAATHDLDPHAATLAAARAQAETLGRVARERVLQELCKLFDEGSIERGLALLDELGLVEPALGPGAAIDPAALHVAAGLARGTGAAAGFALALCGSRFDDEARARAAEWLEALRPSRELARAVAGLLAGLADLARGASNAELVRRREMLDPRDWLALASGFARAGVAIDAPRAAQLAQLLDSWPPERGLPNPLLDARVLIERGIPRGPRLGDVIRSLVDAQIEGRVRTVGEAEAFVAGLEERAD